MIETGSDTIRLNHTGRMLASNTNTDIALKHVRRFLFEMTQPIVWQTSKHISHLMIATPELRHILLSSISTLVDISVAHTSIIMQDLPFLKQWAQSQNLPGTLRVDLRLLSFERDEPKALKIIYNALTAAREGFGAPVVFASGNAAEIVCMDPYSSFHSCYRSWLDLQAKSVLVTVGAQTLLETIEHADASTMTDLMSTTHEVVSIIKKLSSMGVYVPNMDALNFVRVEKFTYYAGVNSSVDFDNRFDATSSDCLFVLMCALLMSTLEFGVQHTIVLSMAGMIFDRLIDALNTNNCIQSIIGTLEMQVSKDLAYMLTMRLKVHINSHFAHQFGDLPNASRMNFFNSRNEYDNALRIISQQPPTEIEQMIQRAGPDVSLYDMLYILNDAIVLSIRSTTTRHETKPSVLPRLSYQKHTQPAASSGLQTLLMSSLSDHSPWRHATISKAWGSAFKAQKAWHRRAFHRWNGRSIYSM